MYEKTTTQLPAKPNNPPTKTLIHIIHLFPDVPGRAGRIRNFMALCYSYKLWYEIDEGLRAGDRTNSGARRINLHDQIMATVGKLFTQVGAKQSFGGTTPNRVMIRKMIIDHHNKFGHEKMRNQRRARHKAI